MKKWKFIITQRSKSYPVNKFFIPMCKKRCFPQKEFKIYMSLYMYTVSIHFKKPQNQVSTQAWKTETDKHQHKTDWTERLVLNMSKTLSKKKEKKGKLYSTWKRMEGNDSVQRVTNTFLVVTSFNLDREVVMWLAARAISELSWLCNDCSETLGTSFNSRL